MCTGLGRTGQHHTARDGLHGLEAQVIAHSAGLERDYSDVESRVLKPSASAGN